MHFSYKAATIENTLPTMYHHSSNQQSLKLGMYKIFFNKIRQKNYTTEYSQMFKTTVKMSDWDLHIQSSSDVD